MQVSVQVEVQGTREAIWKTLTEIENSAETVSAIDKVEILERPESGLIGLKWKETRTMFGKTATEVMWITGVVDGESYDVRAESHGSIYESTVSIAEEDGKRFLRLDFGARPQTFMARVMSTAMGWLFRGATEKALRKDLEDIKAAIEGGS